MAGFNNDAADYDAWFERHAGIFRSELATIRRVLPDFKKGLEIGVGTGRFAAALGLSHGVEPLANFAATARSRGVEVLPGVAEQLPYPDAAFDLALMVTVDCFLDDLPAAFAEAFRVLAPGGAFVVAFLDKNGAIVRKYRESDAPSYRHARFHTPAEITAAMQAAGFRDFHCAQTLFDAESEAFQEPAPGTGRGSFVVVAGRK